MNLMAFEIFPVHTGNSTSSVVCKVCRDFAPLQSNLWAWKWKYIGQLTWLRQKSNNIHLFVSSSKIYWCCMRCDWNIWLNSYLVCGSERGGVTIHKKRWNNKMLLMPEPPHRSCHGVNMPHKNVLSCTLAKGQSTIYACVSVCMCAEFMCVCGYAYICGIDYLCVGVCLIVQQLTHPKPQRAAEQ